jgi:hypothetical protein
MHGLSPRTEIERSYRILELDPDSSSVLVDASWRKLVDEWRPDRFVGDPLLFHRAQARVAELDHAHELLRVHLAGKLDPIPKPQLRTHKTAGGPSYFQRTLVASTAFACVAIAAVLIASPASIQKEKSTEDSAKDPAPAAEPTSTTRSEIQLVAHAPLTVSVSLVENGRILLPETTLYAGQITSVPRLGPTYIKYSAGENLEVTIDGRRYAMPDIGPNRARIN